MVSNVVFLWCVYVCEGVSAYVFFTLFLYFCLFLFYLAFFCLFSFLMREEKKAWSWMAGEVGSIWQAMKD